MVRGLVVGGSCTYLTVGSILGGQGPVFRRTDCCMAAIGESIEIRD